MAKARTIQTPGEPSSEAQGETAATDQTQGDGGESDGLQDQDLAFLKDDKLPPAPAAAPAAPTASSLPPELQALVAAEVAKELRRVGHLKPKPSTAENARLPTPAEAEAMCDAAVRERRRPRAILTTEGYYCHPEMTRVLDDGLAKLVPKDKD